MRLGALSIFVASDNLSLRDGLIEIGRSGTVGPFQFQFGLRHDGLQPMLVPGLDGLVVDIGSGTPSDLAYLARVIDLGPDAPVIAIGRDDPQLQMDAMSVGAEDCLGIEMGSPRRLALALRRAIVRRQQREASSARQTKPAHADTRQVTLVQEASDAIVILDNRGHVRFANQAAEDILGRTASELIGQPFGLPSEIGEHEVTVERPDGDNRFAEMRIIDTRWGGTPARLAALTDITVRDKLERTMQKVKADSLATQKRSKNFFSNVNHDLRTPLTHIIGFSELMKNEQFGPMGQDRYRDYASDIHSSGTMLLDMIEDLLGIAEAETDEISLTDEICNLGQLVEIAAASQRSHAQHDRVTLEIDCPTKVSGIRGDARRLRQGLFRLLSEAIHCAHDGATLRLAVKETENGIVLSITEILSESSRSSVQARLPYLADDPFVSTENSGIARCEGLALSLTRKVMEMHGGSLDVIQSEDEPVTISLTFPASRLIR